MIRKITLSLMILLMLCGISNADFVYMTSAGSLGYIKVNSSSDFEVPSLQYTGSLSSPFLMSYWNGSSTNIMVIDRNATASGDRAYIFRPDDLTTYARSADIAGVHGTDTASYSENGYSVFLGAGSNIYEVRTSTFRMMNSFDCERVISSDEYAAEILSLAADSSAIHAIASAGERQKYIRLDGQLKTGVRVFLSADLSADASCVISLNSLPVIGSSAGIDVMRRNGLFYRVISTDYPVNAICEDNNRNFFYSTQYYDISSDKYVNTIANSAASGLFTPITISSSAPNLRLVRDNSHRETIAAMTDEGIRIISYVNGWTFSHEYTASDLGGTPAGIASATVSGYNGNSSSSGCDSLYAGLVLLAALPFVMRRK